jgi:chemosensory pili system protein ChpC
MESVRSLSIPVVGANLLVPHAAIAEIIQYQEPERPPANAKPWLLGTLDWREQKIPLISWEVASGAEPPLPRASMRIVILKSWSSREDFPYFAILTQRIPRLMTVYEESIEPLGEDVDATELDLAHVLANGEPAIIPDLDKLETKAREVL